MSLYIAELVRMTLLPLSASCSKHSHRHSYRDVCVIFEHAHRTSVYVCVCVCIFLSATCGPLLCPSESVGVCMCVCRVLFVWVWASPRPTNHKLAWCLRVCPAEVNKSWCPSQAEHHSHSCVLRSTSALPFTSEKFLVFLHILQVIPKFYLPSNV